MLETIPSTALILTGALGAFLLAALLPYRAVRNVVGRPVVAVGVGLLALAALGMHLSEHIQEFAESLQLGVPGWLAIIGLALLIATLGCLVERIYHSHETEEEHAAHEHAPGGWPAVTRMLILGVHAFLDGHIMTSLGLTPLVLPFFFHKAVDGLVVNGERTSKRKTKAWQGRVLIQLIATTAGAFLYRETLPEIIHLGLTAAVIGLYAGTLWEYATHRA